MIIRINPDSVPLAVSFLGGSRYRELHKLAKPVRVNGKRCRYVVRVHSSECLSFWYYPNAEQALAAMEDGQ